jgi:hypothetical protein
VITTGALALRDGDPIQLPGGGSRQPGGRATGTAGEQPRRDNQAR